MLILSICSILSATDLLDRLTADYRESYISFDDLMIRQVALLTRKTPLEDEQVLYRPVKCGTHVLKSLGENHKDLSAAAIASLSALGVDFSRSIPGLFRPPGLDRHFDAGIFRLHYTLEGVDAVDPSDENGDGIPDYVFTIANVFDAVSDLILNDYGYVRPPSDDWYEDNGGNGLYDIYIMQLGTNLYGYTQWEFLASENSGDNEYSAVQEKNASTSYLVMRNNYDPFPYSELESIQVTAAHEFYHAVQFGYDGWEATWLLEATATWMEDEVYDDINDNYQYLKEWFDESHLALNYDSGPHWYGSWIFFRYISEHVGGRSTVREILEEGVRYDSRQPGDHSIRTIDAALRRLASSFRKAFASMVIANVLLSSDRIVGEYSYEEADDYRAHGILPSYRESIVLFDTEYEFSHTSGSLMQNASHHIQVTAAEGPMEIRFWPESVESIFQVVAIVQRSLGTTIVHNIGANTIIDVPPDAGNLVVAVITDTTKTSNYNYSLNLEPDVPLPSTIALSQNYPNPFNKTTTLRFFLPKVEPVSLAVFSLEGKKVANVPLPILRQGFNDAEFEVKNLSSGIYIVKIEGRSATASRKIALIK